MITLPEHIGEPWQWKAGVKSSTTADRPDHHGLAAKVRGALTAAPRSRDLLESAREANRVCGNRSCLARYRAQHSAIVFTRYRR